MAESNNNQQIRWLSSEIERKKRMTKFSFTKSLRLAFASAVLILASSSIHAADIRANAGTTFDLVPTTDPAVFSHTVDGVAEVSLLGNSIVHFDVVVRFPANPSLPPALKGSLTITSADGATTLKASVEGTGTPDLANIFFLNFHYDVTFTGGTGQFADARGEAKIDGAALFTSQSTGKATWKMKGHVLGINQGKK